MARAWGDNHHGQLGDSCYFGNGLGYSTIPMNWMIDTSDCDASARPLGRGDVIGLVNTCR